jgi:hypothetical protein
MLNEMTATFRKNAKFLYPKNTNKRQFLGYP